MTHTERPPDRLESMTAGDLERLLERAAQTGARRALREAGLDGQDAAEDIRHLRSLLAGLRMASRTAVQTSVRMITTAILLALGNTNQLKCV
jgi:hypothetical protein